MHRKYTIYIKAPKSQELAEPVGTLELFVSDEQGEQMAEDLVLELSRSYHLLPQESLDQEDLL
jgi:hypothetical protein